MKPNLGTWAIYSIQLWYLYPRCIRDEKFLNADQKDRIERLLAIKMDIWSINHTERRYIVLRHLPAETEELYCSILHAFVTTPGKPLQLLELVETTLISAEEQEELAKAIESNTIVTDSAELSLDYRYISSTREDIEIFNH